MSRRFVAVTLLTLTVLASPAALPSRSDAAALLTPSQLRPELVGAARQLVIVSSTSWKATSASVTYYELGTKGWKKVAGSFYARVGRNGMKVDHIEGDGTTPAGSFPLVSAFGLRANPGTNLPWRKLARGDCWISDSARPDYNNRVVQQPCGSKNEDLWSIARKGAYLKAIVTGYNMEPVVPGKGSAIFVHLHSRMPSGATKATAGCVSLSDWQLSIILKRLDPAANPTIVMGPAAWLID